MKNQTQVEHISRYPVLFDSSRQKLAAIVELVGLRAASVDEANAERNPDRFSTKATDSAKIEMNPSIGLASLRKAQSDPASDLALVTPIARRKSAAGFQSCLTKLEVVADFVTVIGAVMSGYFMYHVFGLGKQLYYPKSIVLAVSATFAAIIVLMLDRVGAYSSGTSLLRVRESEHVLRVSMQALGFVLAVSFFTSFLFSRWLLVIALGLVPLFLFVQKHFVLTRAVLALKGLWHRASADLWFGVNRTTGVLGSAPFSKAWLGAGGFRG